MSVTLAWVSPDWHVGVFNWILGALVYGTLAAGVTWLLVLTVFRRARPAVHGLLWTLVLVKFLIPFGPEASFSLASMIGGIDGWSPARAPSVAKPPGEGSLAFVFVEGAPRAAVQTPPGAAAPAATPASSAWRAWLMAAYALVVATLAALRLRAYFQFTRRCRRLPRADLAIAEMIAGVCDRLGVRRVPAVHIADSITGPFVFGLLRPVLVLPTRQLADRAEVEAVALHEIAHLRRGDLLVRHFQWLVGTLLFFWPIVAWVNRRIDLVREYACDEWALRHGRLSAGDYARCLLRAAHPARPTWSHYRPAAMAASRVNVERRIDMILNAQSRVSRRWTWLPIGSAVAVWGAFVLTGAAPAVGAAAKEDGAGAWTTESGQTVVVVRGSQLNQSGQPQQQINVEVLAGEEAAPGALFLTEGAPQMFIARCEEGDGHRQVRIATVALRTHDEAGLAQFLSQHPNADVNGDGMLTSVEHDAYLAAQVVADPTAVLNQYPKADRNADGAIDATEAARLIAGGGELEGLPAFGSGVWSAAAPAGAGEDGAPQVIKLRRRMNDGAGEAAPDMIPLIEAADGQRRKVIVRRVEKPDGTMSVTVNDDCAEADADLPDILTRAKHFMPAAVWVKQNLTADVSAAQVAALVPAVEQAPLALFLEHNPDADANHDGRLTPDERDAYIERHMSKVREKLLERHPDADANGDGLLTNDELKVYFRDRGPQMGAGADDAGRRVKIMRKDDGGDVVTVTEERRSDEK